MTFNDKFKINGNEYINIELETDNKMFVDPYLIYLGKDERSTICSNRIVNYFSQLLKHAIDGNDTLGHKIVKYLHENNEVRLGYSKSKPCGTGFGQNKGIIMYETIKNSNAVKSGLVKDIFDASILIENVGFDRISDLTINIIFEELITFTNEICTKYNIPTTEIVLNKPIWSDKMNRWISQCKVKLPTHNNEPIVLVPKNFANRTLAYSYKRFYDNQMMIYYGKYAIKHPSEGLVKILKRGIVPAKCKIRKKYPCIKSSVIKFIYDNPDEYLEYKNKQLKYVTYKNL